MKMKMFVLFYKIGDQLYLANCSERYNSQSFGPITNVREDAKLSNEDHAVVSFKWLYKNTYDDKEGVCDAYLFESNNPKTREPNVMLFIHTDDGQDFSYIGKTKKPIKLM